MSTGLGSTFWERPVPRHRDDTLSRRDFVGAISLLTCLGLFLSVFVAKSTMAWQPGLGGFLLIGIGVPIVGIMAAQFSKNWLISLTGYLMVVVGLSAVLGPAVATYELAIVIKAIVATLGVSMMLSIIGIVYPESLEHWGIYLFGALAALVCLQLSALVMPWLGVPIAHVSAFQTVLSYIGVVVFSLYIVFDWNRAMRLEYTFDNAIDCALHIWLDVINLFLRLLHLMGNKSRD